MGFKIERRSIFTNPLLSLQIFLIPLMTYFLVKLVVLNIILNLFGGNQEFSISIYRIEEEYL